MRLLSLQTISGMLFPAILSITSGSAAFAGDIKDPEGGQPTEGMERSVKNLAEQIAYQRAFEAIIWAMPASAQYGVRKGVFQFPGVKDNVIISYSGPLTSKHKAITSNSSTPYITAHTDLRKGPVVLILPPKSEKVSLYGQIVDAWQLTIADVGPSGEDKGKGGKYLLLPPGYEGDIPEGYFVIQSPGYRVGSVFRAVKAPGATNADAYAYTKKLEMYYLSEADNPGPTSFVDGLPYPLYSLPLYDLGALKDIHDIISVEPVREQDKVMMGMLASIGIERGKPFNPPEQIRGALTRGITDAYYYVHQLAENLHEKNLYWPDRHWSFVMVPDEAGGFEFVTDEAVDIDRRAASWSFFTFYPKKLADKPATVYLAPIRDSAGRPLAAGQTYRVRVPADIPAKQFWSVSVYDDATWAFLDNPMQRSGLGTFNKGDLKTNPDNSIDIYFGPAAPEGLESNWIPTMDKKPYVWLRLYGPDDAFWDKTFKMPDVVRVEP